MIIKEDINLKYSLQPHVTSILDSLKSHPDIPICHKNYNVRHPSAIYTISLGSVVDRILTVLDSYDLAVKDNIHLSKNNTELENKILESIDHMLDALAEHIESCSGVIRCFFSDSDCPEFKKSKADFDKAIKPYRDNIFKVVNFIKHNQGKLRLISFFYEAGIVLGYFVEGPIGDGVGPAPHIHGNPGYAFSLNRDLRLHICGLYAISRRLAVTLHAINRGLTHTHKKIDVQNNSEIRLKLLLERISALRPIFFPDELSKPIPEVTITSQKVKICVPSDRFKPKAPPAGTSVKVSLRGDGVTQNFSIPKY